MLQSLGVDTRRKLVKDVIDTLRLEVLEVEVRMLFVDLGDTPLRRLDSHGGVMLIKFAHKLADDRMLANLGDEDGPRCIDHVIGLKERQIHVGVFASDLGGILLRVFGEVKL